MKTTSAQLVFVLALPSLVMLAGLLANVRSYVLVSRRLKRIEQRLADAAAEFRRQDGDIPT